MAFGVRPGFQSVCYQRWSPSGRIRWFQDPPYLEIYNKDAELLRMISLSLRLHRSTRWRSETQWRIRPQSRVPFWTAYKYSRLWWETYQSAEPWHRLFPSARAIVCRYAGWQSSCDWHEGRKQVSAWHENSEAESYWLFIRTQFCYPPYKKCYILLRRKEKATY